jgi:predicted PurR-regulated permease PerM
MTTGLPKADIRLLRVLLWMLVLAATIFVVRQVYDVVSLFADVVVLFAVAWLVAFLIGPLARYLSRARVLRPLGRLLRSLGWARLASRFEEVQLPYALAVSLVYMGVLLALALFALFAIPAIVDQSVALGQAVPRLVQALPGLLQSALAGLQSALAERGIALELSTLYEPAEIAKRAQELGTQLVQLAFNLATGVASTVVNILLILTIAFYMNLDTPRLRRQVQGLVPDHYQGRLSLIGQSLSRTFGGFLRGQLLLAALYGFAAVLAMVLARIGMAVVIGTICGVLMLVPLLGAPVAMVLPALVALAQSTKAALWLFIVLTAYQQLLLQVLAPKLMAEAVGMPPLLVLGAIMVSMRLMGLWGFVFGIPLAGVIYAVTVAYLEQAKIQREAVPKELPGSSGSICYVPATGPGCLLVPELGRRAEDMADLARLLAQGGVTSLAISPYQDEAGGWEDWYATLLVALDRLWANCGQVFLYGEGTGAMLALLAAAETPARGVALLSLAVEDGRIRPFWEDVRPGVPARLEREAQMLKRKVEGVLGDIRVPVVLLEPTNGRDSQPDYRWLLGRLGTDNWRVEVVPIAGRDEFLRRLANSLGAFIRGDASR